MVYVKSRLFEEMDKESLEDYLKRARAHIKEFQAGAYIFYEGDPCDFLFVLLEGAVQVETSSSQGKRILVNRFQKEGTIFGEVYLYLRGRPYDYSCLSPHGAKVLLIPKEALDPSRGKMAQKLCENMLEILSNKAFFLNQKLLVQGAGSLKQKIAMYLLQKGGDRGQVDLILNRQELADYLGVARPSLSRQLMLMEREKILSIEKNKISYDVERLEELAF